MKNDDFIEILKQKLTRDLQKETIKPQYAPLEPLEWNFVWPRSPQAPLRFTPKKVSYKKSKKPKNRRTSAKGPQTPSSSYRQSSCFDLISIKQLSPMAQQAAMTLQKLGAQFDDDRLNLQVLKKQFRRLAKTYHPDHAPLKIREQNSKIFIQLKNAEKTLNAEIQKRILDSKKK